MTTTLEPAPSGNETTPRLLAWYDCARRDLPWRRRRDPWAIWVSEVMLQQTRVEVVVPYFERFLDRFPDCACLAAAPVEEALALWSGLGYYRRCRQLHAAAERVVALGGALPQRAAALERLPGVGPYTAAAIASIAFGESVPVLDGNVARVMARRLALDAEVASAAARRELAAAAATLLDPRRPGDSNQALMELGATLCTPRAPRCEACPLAEGCRGHEAGEPERYPRPRRRPAEVAVTQTAALVERGGRLLFVRRGAGEAQLAGLWELPTVEAENVAAEQAFAAAFGGRWRLSSERVRMAHAITFRRISLSARGASFEGEGVGEGREAAWLTPAEARSRPLTGASRKLLDRLAPLAPIRARSRPRASSRRRG